MECLIFGREDIGHSGLMKKFYQQELTIKILLIFSNFGGNFKFSIEN